MSTDGGRDIEVAPNWLRATEESRETVLSALESEEWRAEIMKMPQDEPSLGDERIWCDKKIVDQLCEAKRILNEHSSERIEEVRTRTNPHEPLLKNKTMAGRMSLLLASIDRVFDFILTDENIEDAETKCPLDTNQKGVNIDRDKELFYFAETQSMNVPYASQYVMLRKGFYNAKCFIPRSVKEISPLLSLALVDTIMKKEQSISQIGFNPFTPSIRQKLTSLVLESTRKGIHFYAGFTHNIYNPKVTNRDQSRGDQGQKELLFRDSYVGQLFYASSLVREGGRAILQFLDTNTSTSVAVLYLAHIIYDRVSIYKPNMSRPANAEKFLICDGLRSREAKAVHRFIKTTMDAMKPDESIRRLMPDRVMDQDENFIEYFSTANKCLAVRQLKFLRSSIRMLEDESRENSHQRNCLRTCLPYYLVPFISLNEKKILWQREKQRKPGDILASILPEGMNQQEVMRCVSNCLPKLHIHQLSEKLKGSNRLNVTPCAANISRLIIGTRNGIYYADRGRFQLVTDDPCILPPETVLMGDLFQINNGQYLIVRILDVALIYGDNVSRFPFQKRRIAAAKLTEACRKDGFKPEVIFTMASYGRLEREWKPDLISSRVVENKFNFERVKFRLVDDSSTSFFDLCRGEGICEM